MPLQEAPRSLFVDVVCQQCGCETENARFGNVDAISVGVHRQVVDHRADAGEFGREFVFVHELATGDFVGEQLCTGQTMQPVVEHPEAILTIDPDAERGHQVLLRGGIGVGDSLAIDVLNQLDRRLCFGMHREEHPPVAAHGDVPGWRWQRGNNLDVAAAHRGVANAVGKAGAAAIANA